MNLSRNVQEVIDYHFEMQDLEDNEILVAPLPREERVLRFSEIASEEEDLYETLTNHEPVNMDLIAA